MSSTLKLPSECRSALASFPTVREEALDQAVWEAIKEAILNPSIIADQLARLYSLRAKNVDNRNTETHEVKVLLENLRREEERVLEAYRTGVLSPTQLGKELEKLHTRKSVLEGRKAKAASGDNVTQDASVRRSLTDYCKIAAERLDRFNRSEQQQFLRTLINEVVFEGKQVRIRGVIPISETKDRNWPDGSPSKSGIADTTSYTRSRNADRVADAALDRRGRISGMIEGIRRDSQALNSVDDVFFELLKAMPENPIPLNQQIMPELLHRLIEQHPRATLQQLCEQVKLDFGVRLSITSMGRLLRRQGLTCRARRHLHIDGCPITSKN